MFFLHVPDLFLSQEFKVTFNVFELNDREFMRLVLTKPCAAATSLTLLLEQKVLRHTSPGGKTTAVNLYSTREDKTMQELGTEQVQTVLPSPLAFSKYCEKDIRVCYILICVFRQTGCKIPCITSACISHCQ